MIEDDGSSGNCVKVSTRPRIFKPTSIFKGKGLVHLANPTLMALRLGGAG